ncbi:MAG: glycerophosphodiester phosphodiesterase [Candidatus Hodarchaeota archaeon]
MEKKKKILLSGHRGYKSLEIENTEKAFLRAIKEKLDFVEFDVKKTRDNIPVVFHDEYLTRLLKVKKRISTITLRELKRYKYADGQEVLTLEEYFSLTGKRIRSMLEIKSRGIERQILELVVQNDLQESIIIQSFTGSILKTCAKMEPVSKYGLCMGPLGGVGPVGRVGLHYLIGAVMFLFGIKPYPVTYLNLDGPFIYDEFIKICLLNGKKIILGARNTWNYLDKLGKWGVEIINADNPALIKKLLIERGFSL